MSCKPHQSRRNLSRRQDRIDAIEAHSENLPMRYRFHCGNSNYTIRCGRLGLAAEIRNNKPERIERVAITPPLVEKEIRHDGFWMEKSAINTAKGDRFIEAFDKEYNLKPIQNTSTVGKRLSCQPHKLEIDGSTPSRAISEQFFVSDKIPPSPPCSLNKRAQEFPESVTSSGFPPAPSYIHCVGICIQEHLCCIQKQQL